MQILKLVMQSSLLTNGCKLYYQYLYKLSNASKINNWLILDGKFRGNNFIIAKDSHACKQLNISRASVQIYKKRLKQLNLIHTLPKFSFKTNIGKNNYWHQATVLTTIPRKLIASVLKLPTNIKKIKIVQAPTKIISQVTTKLNNKIKQISSNFAKKLHLYFYEKSKNIKIKYNINETFTYNDENVNKLLLLLNKYNINYRQKDINKFFDLFMIDQTKFVSVCKICANKLMYAPVKYFSAVFKNYHNNNNRFCDFPHRNYPPEYWKNLTNKLILNNVN